MERTVGEIAQKLGLEVKGDRKIKNLLTDSRELENPEVTLFFAIATTGNDGHRYIPELYRRGVRSFVVTHIPEEMKNIADADFLVVRDVVEALQRVASRPEEFGGHLLAITGSRGKTTLKEWLFQLMEPLGDISRSPRSYNSQTGVPLSMWGLDMESRLGIIEAGISRKGEMAALARCIAPDTVIITNIGEMHSEGFAGNREKAEEKALLASGERTKRVIYCADYKEIEEAVAVSAPGKEKIRWTYGDADADLRLHRLGHGATGEKIEWEWRAAGSPEYSRGLIEAPLESDADYENAANALAFMLSRGVSPEVIAERFSQFHKIGTRLNVTEGVNGCVLIRDSYAPDFSSLRPALHFARRRQGSSQGLTVILSDLHHEDCDEDALYGRIAGLMESAGVSRFIGIGSALKRHADAFGAGATFFADLPEFFNALTASDFADETILLKGEFDQIEEMLEARRHETVLEVNLDAMVRNYNYFRSHLPSSTGIVCMVKASGYGAGSYEVAKTLQDNGASYLAVAVLDEGVELRRRGITMPIMVMNPRVANYKAMFANRLEPEIYSFDMLRDVIREAGKNGITDYPIHIKLDTGMHRMGFTGAELPDLMDLLSMSKNVKAKSVFSHLATADCPDMNDFTELQLRRFREWTDYMEERSDHYILRHVLNTAGILRYPEHHYDMVRLGIGLYGANTLPAEMEKPLSVVSTLRTVIIAVRDWERGETVGYGRRGVLERDSRIATIAIGYADGMNRHFGRGAVKVVVNGKEAPTVGNICMDACMIDVTGIDCKVGDAVEIFGTQAPLDRLSDLLDTIPYEVLTSVSPRVKRVYYRE